MNAEDVKEGDKLVLTKDYGFISDDGPDITVKAGAVVTVYYAPGSGYAAVHYGRSNEYSAAVATMYLAAGPGWEPLEEPLEEPFDCYVCGKQLSTELNTWGLVPVACGDDPHGSGMKDTACLTLPPTDPRIAANKALRDRIADVRATGGVFAGGRKSYLSRDEDRR